MALFNILVGTLKDGILLEGLHGLLLFNTAKAGLGIILATTEVNASTDLNAILTTTSGLLASISSLSWSSMVSQSQGNNSQ